MSNLIWHRDGPGRRVSACGRYAVAADGYEKSNSVCAEEGTGYEGFKGGEWAAVLVATDDNLDWFDTMREAKAECERHARTS